MQSSGGVSVDSRRLEIGWASWRTLIAAELVFGVSSRSGGLGWFIFENRNQLETAYVFAGLTTVIVIGLLVESVVFRTVETHTVRKWGMQREQASRRSPRRSRRRKRYGTAKGYCISYASDCRTVPGKGGPHRG